MIERLRLDKDQPSNLLITFVGVGGNLPKCTLLKINFFAPAYPLLGILALHSHFST